MLYELSFVYVKVYELIWWHQASCGKMTVKIALKKIISFFSIKFNFCVNDFIISSVDELPKMMLKCRFLFFIFLFVLFFPFMTNVVYQNISFCEWDVSLVVQYKMTLTAFEFDSVFFFTLLRSSSTMSYACVQIIAITFLRCYRQRCRRNN